MGCLECRNFVGAMIDNGELWVYCDVEYCDFEPAEYKSVKIAHDLRDEQEKVDAALSIVLGQEHG